MIAKPLYSLTAENRRDIDTYLDGLDITEQKERQTGQLLLSILCGETVNPDKLAKINGLNRDFCRLICKRLKYNGIIDRGKLTADWFNENPELGTLDFCLTLLVAEGLVVRYPDEDDIVRFKAASIEAP